MSANVLTINQKRPLRLKGIALPIEHGSWGFLFEPLVAGFVVAFSAAAPWIAIMVIGAFLTRQPLKVYLSDRMAKRDLPQTAFALKFIYIFGAFSLLGLFGSLAATELKNFLPFAMVAPFAIYQIYCDFSRKSRELIPELTGAVTISSSAAVLALAGGWSFGNALCLWAIFVARLIPSILYVRNRLRLEKGKNFSMSSVVVSNAAALLVIGLLAGNGLIPLLTIPIFAFLAVRAIVGLSPYHRKIKAMRIGIWEVVYGALTVLSVIFGYLLHL